MGLTSAPVEIILYILQSCDNFTELRALVLWHVAPKVIPGFGWALLAVRATDLVHDAHRNGTLPPEISPGELAGELRKPSLRELDSVLGLHHFVQCVELRYCHDHLTINETYNRPEIQPQNLWPEDRKPPPPINTPEDRGEGMRVWTERFHTAAYTSLLMGAVFTRAYNQPFYPAKVTAAQSSSYSSSNGTSSRTEDQLRRTLWAFMRNSHLGFSDEGQHRLTADEEILEYLRRFPVYDLNDELGNQEKVFGPFIDWFVGFTISQYNNAKPKPATRDPSRPDVELEIKRLEAALDRGEDVDRCPELPGNAFMDWPRDGTLLSESFPPSFVGTPAEGETVVWAAMQVVHIFEFILTCVTRPDGKRFFGRTCTAKVVLFGIFEAEEVLMQADVKRSTEEQLVAHSPPTLPSPSSLYLDSEEPAKEFLDIPLVLDDLYNYSGIANQNDSFNTPPPPLQIFTFMLRHDFNLQFCQIMFSIFLRTPQTYWLFKKRATIFAHGHELVPERNVLDYTNGMEFLEPYETPNLYYEDPNDFEDAYLGNPRTWEPDYAFFEEFYSGI
ncbi:hypothetical protein B0T20DRAFT_345907 [Sordaria brevicollis]|uniref:Uncharacterized protein n=1 Tax=Sordaria brevicollis TaxID=83679 RepID=A0AAE0PLK4_SORBR|nr:hypothetical protein B0T20DRAFT_345907 [Sordaria brevicollis]